MKPTTGMWKLQKLEYHHNDYENWKTFAIRSSQNVCLATVGEVDRYCESENEANAELIVTAVNQCKAINAEHPECVAKNIEKMWQFIKMIAKTPESMDNYAASALLDRIEGKE